MRPGMEKIGPKSVQIGMKIGPSFGRTLSRSKAGEDIAGDGTPTPLYLPNPSTRPYPHFTDGFSSLTRPPSRPYPSSEPSGGGVAADINSRSPQPRPSPQGEGEPGGCLWGNFERFGLAPLHKQRGKRSLPAFRSP